MLEEIANHLVAQGMVGEGWVIHQGFLPPQPDQAIAIIAGAGAAPFETSDRSIWQPGFQVLVRAREWDTPTAMAKLEAIRGVLHRFAGTLGTAAYVWIKAQGDILALGQDESNRPELVLNFSALRST
jgi:hypothetical protein